MTRRVSALAVVASGALLALGVAGFSLARDRDRDHAERRLLADLSSAHARFAADLTAHFEDVKAQLASPRALDDVGRIAIGPEGFSVAQATRAMPMGTDLGEDRARLTLEARADAGDAGVVALPVEGERRSALVVVLPQYASPVAEGTLARRATLTGFAVGSLDVAGLVERSYRDLAPSISVGFGSRSLVQPSTAGSAVGTVEVPLADRLVTVSALAPGVGVTGTDLAILLVPCALAVLILGESAARAERLRRIEAGARSQGRAQRLIADLGPALQKSLDLADVLPSVALRLADEFDLAGLSVSINHADGDSRELFAYGITRGREADLALDAVPLRRGGRTIGWLEVMPRRPLDADQRRILDAVAHLVSGAVANALAYESEQAAVRRLHELDRLKTEFVGTISHELRTPLTAIIGFGHLLEARWGTLADDEAADFLARINRNAGALSGLLRQVLDFSRLERNVLAVMPEVTDVAELARLTVERMAPVTAGHHVTVDAPAPVLGLVDGEAFERIVSNLLTNAVKYAPAGSSVRVSVRREGSWVVLAVDDAGPGIEPEEREAVFERFYRGVGEAARRTRGAGIGLAVVKELADRMQGTVRVDSSPAGGARLIVRLPAASPVPVMRAREGRAHEAAS